jgi:hypothetical protein
MYAQHYYSLLPLPHAGSQSDDDSQWKQTGVGGKLTKPDQLEQLHCFIASTGHQGD